MASRYPPPVCCPMPDCRSPQTRQRYARYYRDRLVIVQHRVCKKCGQRFRTEQAPPRFAGLDRMPGPRTKAA